MLKNVDQVMNEIMGIHKQIQKELQENPPCKDTYRYIADLLGDAKRLSAIHENLVKYGVTECQIDEGEWHHDYLYKRMLKTEATSEPIGYLRKQALNRIGVEQ
jgi:hypothetical protein